MANDSNLIPAQPGEVRNPAGRPKGSKNLSTIIRNLMDKDIDWDKMSVSNVEKLKARYHNNNMWEAIVYVAAAQAVTGDAMARRWLSESAFGRNINISAEGEIDVVHIYKPEKLSTGDFNSEGAILRDRARKAVEAEVSDLESTTGTANNSIANPGLSQ